MQDIIKVLVTAQVKTSQITRNFPIFEELWSFGCQEAWKKHHHLKPTGFRSHDRNLQALNHIQIFGASLTILGGVLYGRSRQAIELEAEERKSLLPRKWVNESIHRNCSRDGKQLLQRLLRLSKKAVRCSVALWNGGSSDSQKCLLSYCCSWFVAGKGKKNRRELNIHTR